MSTCHGLAPGSTVPMPGKGGGASANRTICGADTPPPSAQAGPGCGAPARRGRRCGCTTGSGGTRAESRGQPGRTCGAKRAAADRRHTARGWPPWAAGRCPKELCRGLAEKPCRPSRDSTAPPPHPPHRSTIRVGWVFGQAFGPGRQNPRGRGKVDTLGGGGGGAAGSQSCMRNPEREQCEGCGPHPNLLVWLKGPLGWCGQNEGRLASQPDNNQFYLINQH